MMEEKLGREKSSREMKCVKRVGPCIHVTRPGTLAAHGMTGVLLAFFYFGRRHTTPC